MTDEMKLLTKLCEALGFEVRQTRDYKERKESEREAMTINRDPSHERGLRCGAMGRLFIDEDGCYISVLKKPITDYVVEVSED